MSKKVATHRSWRQVLYGHLALARISNSPTIISNTLAGVALAGAPLFNLSSGLVALAMMLFYTAGMYLNDLLDYPIDCRKRPERPLPSGLVSRAEAATCTIVFLVSGSVLLQIVGTSALLSGVLLIALILCYDRWHKHNPLSPMLMALCRGMVYVTAFLAFSAHSYSSSLLVPTALLIFYVLALTSLARTEKQSRIVVMLLFLPAVYFATRLSLFSLPMLLCFTGWIVYSLSFIYRAKRQIGRAVGQLIAGISLLDGLVLVTIGSLLGSGLALAAFLLTLYLQRYVRGT